MTRSCYDHIKSSRFLLTFFLLLLLSPSEAAAHKIKIFAAPEGDTITGVCYYPGGEKYRQGTVMVLGPDNLLLGEVKTDDKGAFTFKPTRRTDHIFVIETADGHRAQYVVRADELAEILPTAGTPSGPDGPAEQTQGVAPQKASAAIVPPAGTKQSAITVSSQDLQELLAKTVARHINPLREQIDRYEEKIRLHDILGGIGYILGIAGMALYYLGRKK